MNTLKSRTEPKFRTLLVITSAGGQSPVWVDPKQNSISLVTVSDEDFALLERGVTTIENIAPLVEMSLSDQTMLVDSNSHEVIE